MKYELPDLPYDYGALEPHYSGKMLELHHAKHHAAYVEKLNATLDQLAEARAGEDWDAIVGLDTQRGVSRVGPEGPRLGCRGEAFRELSRAHARLRRGHLTCR